jgi:hypothetical protein
MEDVMDFIEEQASAWTAIHQLFKDSHFFSKPLETPDGPGATVESTVGLREWLPTILREYNIGTMLDAACGDANWMRLVDLGDITYTGWDVDDERILRAQRNTANTNGNPHTRFECKNLLTVNTIPRFDLILSRHFLQHLPTNDLIEHTLGKFRLSESPYLLATTFPGADNSFEWDPRGTDHAWLGYFERPYDLCAAPFNLDPPLETFTENLGPGGILTVAHQLALFKL